MTSCGWTKVGTVEFSPDFFTKGLQEKAVVATDIAIDALTKTFQSKLEVLEGFKQTLLCLENKSPSLRTSPPVDERDNHDLPF